MSKKKSTKKQNNSKRPSAKFLRDKAMEKIIKAHHLKTGKIMEADEIEAIEIEISSRMDDPEVQEFIKNNTFTEADIEAALEAPDVQETINDIPKTEATENIEWPTTLVYKMLKACVPANKFEVGLVVLPTVATGAVYLAAGATLATTALGTAATAGTLMLLLGGTKIVSQTDQDAYDSGVELRRRFDARISKMTGWFKRSKKDEAEVTA